MTSTSETADQDNAKSSPSITQLELHAEIAEMIDPVTLKSSKTICGILTSNTALRSFELQGH